MPDPTWPSSPPEVNYLRLVGPGAGGTATTMASAAAWQALAVGDEVAAAVSTANTAATALGFEGVGGLSSSSAAGGLNTALQLLAGWAQEKPPILAGAVSAYETAVSSMIPAEVSIANRTEQASCVAMNPLVLGALTPAIVALDAAYFGEFWPHNAGVGVAYGSALAALTAALTVPPPLAPPGALPAAPGTAAAAVAQSAGQAVAGEAMKESGQAARLAGDGAAAPAGAAAQAGALGSTMVQPIQAALGAAQPMAGMFQAPLQALQGLAALPQSMRGESMPGASADLALGAPLLGAAGLSGAGGTGTAVSVPSAPGGAATMAGSPVGAGGVPGAGLTAFSRPNGGFAAEEGGRPGGLKPGLLSAGLLSAGPLTAADVRGPTVSGGAPMPMAPAGMLAPGKDRGDSGDRAQARIVMAGTEPTDRPI